MTATMLFFIQTESLSSTANSLMARSHAIGKTDSRLSQKKKSRESIGKLLSAYAPDSKLRKGTLAYQYAEELCGVFAEWGKELGDEVL